MKNANNTVRSVVTVESDAPKNTSVQKQIQNQIVNLAQVSSTKL